MNTSKQVQARQGAEQTHTPTPWTLNAEREKIEDADGEFVTRLSLSRYHDDRADPIAEANAAFIVRACNSHDELVAALRALLRDGEHDDDAINAAHAALAKAGA